MNGVFFNIIYLFYNRRASDMNHRVRKDLDRHKLSCILQDENKIKVFGNDQKILSSKNLKKEMSCSPPRPCSDADLNFI